MDWGTSRSINSEIYNESIVFFFFFFFFFFLFNFIRLKMYEMNFFW